MAEIIQPTEYMSQDWSIHKFKKMKFEAWRQFEVKQSMESIKCMFWEQCLNALKCDNDLCHDFRDKNDNVNKIDTENFTFSK